MSEKVNIELTKEEAIVLFEFLGRFNELEKSDKVEDQVEESFPSSIECILEKELSEAFRSDY